MRLPLLRLHLLKLPQQWGLTITTRKRNRTARAVERRASLVSAIQSECVLRRIVAETEIETEEEEEVEVEAGTETETEEEVETELDIGTIDMATEATTAVAARTGDAAGAGA